MGGTTGDQCHPAMKDDGMGRRPVEMGEIFWGDSPDGE